MKEANFFFGGCVEIVIIITKISEYKVVGLFIRSSKTVGRAVVERGRPPFWGNTKENAKDGGYAKVVVAIAKIARTKDVDFFIRIRRKITTFSRLNTCRHFKTGFNKKRPVQ